MNRQNRRIVTAKSSTRVARKKAIFNFATKLSECPSEAGSEDMKQLIEVGLGMDEIFDLILTASLFGWANRLMHVLGDPIPSR